MSSERYDEAVREQKKAEREREIKKQKRILAGAAVIVIVAAAVLISLQFQGKDGNKEGNTDAALTNAVSQVYQTFSTEKSGEEVEEELKKEGDAFAQWLSQTYPDATQKELAEAVGKGSLAEQDFYGCYGKTLQVLSDEYKGYLKDDASAAEHRIYLKEGDGKEADLALAGNLVLADDGYAMGLYDQSKDLADLISQEVLDEMKGADVLFLNQECSVSDAGAVVEGKDYILHGGADRLNVLKDLGVDLVSLGNDHAADYGREGLEENMTLLQEAGIAYAGSGSDSSEAKAPVYMIVSGMKIGFLAASGMDDEHQIRASESESGIQTYTEAEEYSAQIADAAKNCDYLIVYMHEGADDSNEISQDQKDHAAAFLKAGADLVIGGHSDRLQGVEYVDGKPVIYGMGAVLPDGTSRYAAVLKLSVTAEGLQKMSLIPCIQNEEKTEYLTEDEERQKMFDAVEALCINAQIDQDGVITQTGQE